jgi:hypothetical protein
MDTLDQTEWDVLIVGTGLQQSLLALYVYYLVGAGGRDLTDAALEEPCRARIRKSSMSTRTTTMGVQRLPLACRKLNNGHRE